MKRLLAAILCSALLLTGCSVSSTNERAQTTTSENQEQSTSPQPEDVAFDNLSDPKALQYIEDQVFSATEGDFNSDDYVVDNVVTSYVSKEYLEELSYNAQENIYFGHTLSELDAQFDETKYVFALGDDGKTEVRGFEAYDDTFDKVLKNVAMGGGVILVSVTITLLASAIGGPAGTTVSTIFAASTFAGTNAALSSGVIGGLASGIATSFETGDVEDSLKAAALGASEGLKWGAITGVIGGGAAKALQLKRTTNAVEAAESAPNVPSFKQSEIDALEAYGGAAQKSFLAGKEVGYGTAGSVRPDFYRKVGGYWEAIEVKNYDLAASSSAMRIKLVEQITKRKQELPSGVRQRVLIDARGRGYTADFIKQIQKDVMADLKEIDPKIRIDIWE